MTTTLPQAQTRGVHLYEIGAMREVLDQWLAEAEGELTPELEALLDEFEQQRDAKIQHVALYIRELVAQAEVVKTEAQRLAQRQKSIERAADSLKNYLKRQMEQLGTTKVAGDLVTVAIQNNSQPTITNVADLKAIYESDANAETGFVSRVEHVEYVLNRPGVVAAWKEQKPLPAGVEVTLGNHVRIR